MTKSITAKISEKILKATKPEYMTSQEKIKEFIKNKEEKTDKKIKTIFKTKYFKNTPIITFGNKNKTKHTILYIHGGAYINELNLQHQLYCYMLSKKLNAYVIAPAYPLTPKHTYNETYSLITDLYEKLIKDNDIILMGDSAGGGFAIGFCQYLNTKGIKQPKNLITFSPWVDISMSGDYKKYENTDPVLGKMGLKEIGQKWAGTLDTQNYKVSPYFGDTSNLPKTLIFTGTNEIFYPDIEKFYKKLKKEKVDVRLITEEDLFHVYPLYPIAEAKKALKEIKKEIKID